MNQGQRKANILTPITTDISIEQLRKTFEKTKESTSSSPSSINMGHYKIASHNHMLREIISLQMSIPFRNGFTTTRWQQSMHIMLEKEKGNNNINNLRIIQLVEADYNAALKIYMRATVGTAIKENIFSHDMHGGLPQRTTHDAHMSQLLLTNMT